ncbi:Ubiquitinyl hydrolase 1 [Quillaja saponaria]|uniref:Ubiquitinyl hydrolase 1 n=1 Tax=Quillaja saponaria TaxID=32244 RepID=A0AAD7QFJ4_QUISA|nr:Ubiquitinyl hydrolase 1 [Quillaja saponaria]
MGKKVKKTTRGPAKEKQVATNSPTKVIQPGNPIVELVDDGVSSVGKGRKPCPHLDKSVDLDKLSSKIWISETVRCGDCREGAANRRGSKGISKHGKKKGVTPGSHAVRHARQNRHLLVVHFEEPQLCWCFLCNKLIPVEKTEEDVEHNDVLLDVVKLLKGQLSERSSVDVENVCFGGGSVMSETKSRPLLTSESSNGRGGYVIRGMVNLGNTCFFNSITQNLLAMDRLRSSLFNLDASVGPLTGALKNLFAETDPEAGGGLKTLLNPRSFFGCVCSKAPQFRGYQQHDSHELLHCLLDGLCTEELAMRKPIKSSKEDRIPSNVGTLIDALFGGQISSTVCCVECGHSSTVYEPFLDISLPVPTKKPPPKKAAQVSRAKKTKMPPKIGERTRTKFNKDAELLPAQSLSSQSASCVGTCQAQPSVPVCGEVVASASNSALLVSTDASTMFVKGVSVLPNSCAIQDSEREKVLEYTKENTSASFDNFTWLDYIDPGTISDEHDLTSENNDISWIEEAESQFKSVNVTPAQANSESSGQFSLLKKELNLKPDDSLVNGWEEEAPLQIQDSEVLLLPYKEESSTTGEIMGGEGNSESSGQFSLLKKELNLKPDDSLVNGWEEEAPLQIQDSEVLLLPYKEESSTTGEIMGGEGEASSAVSGCGQDELEFDGFGDLVNEPEVFAGPITRPSSSSDVIETELMTGNSSESDPDEVDDTDSPVSVECCLVHFTKPELLSNENAWHCENCSRNLQQQELEVKKQTKSASMVSANGGQIRSCGDPQLSEKNLSCPAEVKLINGDIKCETDRESLMSHDGQFYCSNDRFKLENGQTGELIPVVGRGEGGTCEIKGAHLEELECSGSKTSSEESCSDIATVSSSKQRIRKRTLGSNQLLGHGNNELVGNKDEDIDLKSVKVKRDATKRVFIYKAPPILTIHLKRFSQDARGRLS